MYFPVSSAMIEFIILSIVSKHDSYGYEISQTVKLVANIKESTLYPLLKKLEKSGFMTTYSQEHQGRTRKYYTITPEGEAQLIFLTSQWQIYSQTITDIVEGGRRHDTD